jgi:hypothetical protein
MSRVKNFFWRMTASRTKEAMSLFCKLAVIKGYHHTEVLEGLIVAYNDSFMTMHKLHGKKLLGEGALLTALHAAGLGISRTTLVKYRGDGTLEGTWWGHATRNVYDLEAVKGRIREVIRKQKGQVA